MKKITVTKTVDLLRKTVPSDLILPKKRKRINLFTEEEIKSAVEAGVDVYVENILCEETKRTVYYFYIDFDALLKAAR